MAQDSEKKWDATPYDVKFKADYMSDWDIHRNYIQNFDPWEAMLIGQVYDQVSNSVDGSKITDSYAATLAKERADRVIAKLPEGETQAVGKADVGKAMFMDLIRQKWIYPNANSQHSFLEKLNMWQLYSSVYGYMPMFYDWNVSVSGYIGPDCWLWNPRNLVPQQGRTSIKDMDYVTALTWVGKKWLDDLIDDQTEKDGDENVEERGGWNLDALKELNSRCEEPVDVDYHKDTKIARDRTPQATKKGICLATRYESGEDGEWITFAPDHGFMEVRRIKNPHKNGRIPFVIKYSQPLFDSFYGLGDFQRAMPLQFARDGLTNFYFKGIKMNLIPPIIANANGVLQHTLDYREGGVMLETIPNSIRRLETSTAGLATYKDAQSNLTGALLSLYGSQNASISGADSLNPSQGKTPQAINLYSDKEATRDGAERRHLEDAIEELTDGFNSLLVAVGTEDIPMTLFANDIQDIAKAGYTDVLKLYSGKMKANSTRTAADMRINPKELKGVEYRFNIARDSTAKINKDAQRASVVDAIGVMGKMQNVFQDDPRLTVHWEKIMASYEALSDVSGASEWISFDPEAQKAPLPPATPTPSATAMQMPNGAVHESADVVKLFSMLNDPAVKNAILQSMGLPPETVGPPQAEVPPTDPVVAPSGHIFQDPHVGNAATALHNSIQVNDVPMPKAEQPQEPTVASSGHVFSTPHLGSVAEAINKMR